MKLNDIRPGKGSRRPPKRVGRGHSAGQGKTSGRGVKGQHSRSGGYTKTGFEGGQMPLQRRLPKVGFTSPTRDRHAEVRLHELAIPAVDVVDLAVLQAAGLVPRRADRVKVIASGSIERAVTVRGLKVTPGAQAAIEAAGGRVEA